MNKAIAIVFVALMIFGGLAVVASVAAPSVEAETTTPCGGPGQPTCADYCATHPEDPRCRG